MTAYLPDADGRRTIVVLACLVASVGFGLHIDDNLKAIILAFIGADVVHAGAKAATDAYSARTSAVVSAAATNPPAPPRAVGL